MSIPRYDVAVVGGGLLGLGAAREVLMREPRLRVAVVEQEPIVAAHQSGRNSGVLHAGLYYAAGSLKARLCRTGRELILRYADERGIPYRIGGKLVVATHEGELGRLAELVRRAEANGLVGARTLGARELREVEPGVVGVAALHVPETGSIDYRLVAFALADDIRRAGGDVMLSTRVTGLAARHAERLVETTGGELLAHRVLVCAGLQADRLAAFSGASTRDVRVVPFRGDYYVLAAEARELIRAHVYPIPDPAFPFLGVHFSKRVDGEVWAGPNAVPALARERYGRAGFHARDAISTLAFPGSRRLAAKYFRTGLAEIWRDLVLRAALRELQRYLPTLERRHLRRGPAGIRAQLVSRSGELVDDFRIERRDGIVHVLNAPSPAATASLAIAQILADEVLATG